MAKYQSLPAPYLHRFLTTPDRHVLCLHCTDEETEVWQAYVTCPQSHSSYTTVSSL